MTENDLGEATLTSDRRIAERKKLIVDVRFEGGDATGIANTRDIGVGGLYMTTTAGLNIGDRISMTATIREKVLHLGGVVVYTDPGQGVGVRFTDADEANLDLIRTELEN